MKTFLFIGIAVLVLFFGYSQWTYFESLIEKQRVIKTSAFPIVGQQAPGFSLYSIEGKTSSLSDYLGQPLVIDFWTTWYGVCKEEFPLFEEFHHSYGDRIAFLSICSGASLQKTIEIAQEYSLTFPILYDEGKVVARAYQPQEENIKRQITAFPFTVFIDPEGIVVYAKAGVFTTLEDLVNLMRELEFPVDEL